MHENFILFVHIFLQVIVRLRLMERIYAVKLNAKLLTNMPRANYMLESKQSGLEP
jgi:hypothetical protein